MLVQARIVQFALHKRLGWNECLLYTEVSRHWVLPWLIRFESRFIPVSSQIQLVIKLRFVAFADGGLHDGRVVPDVLEVNHGFGSHWLSRLSAFECFLKFWLGREQLASRWFVERVLFIQVYVRIPVWGQNWEVVSCKVLMFVIFAQFDCLIEFCPVVLHVSLIERGWIR